MQKLILAIAAFLSAAAFADDTVYVIPTPAEMTVGAGELAAGGLEVTPCAGVPEYALARLGEFAGKGLAFTFARDAALGEQAYRLEVGPDGVTATANDERGFIYAVSSFRQLVCRTPNGLRVPHVRICDKPAFETRGTCWDLLVEHGNWGYDDGDGAEAIYRRTLDGLDMLADFKLNAVFFDGMGWCPERFPGYGKLMRRISAAARERGIRIGISGHHAGYGVQFYESDGPKFRNVGADGKEYGCLKSEMDDDSKFAGSCLSNERLCAAKFANIVAFVRATEPGFLYIHGLDSHKRTGAIASWLGRCADCRRRWPNDDTTAPDGMAGAYAAFFDRMYAAIASVKNAASGYDAARDCQVHFVAPNYGDLTEEDDDWAYHVAYFKTLSRCMKERAPRFMVREQFTGLDGRDRMPQLRAAVGPDVKFSCIFFCSGDGYYDSVPFTADVALTRYQTGANDLLFGCGNPFQEPRQVAIAEYAWNPTGTAYPVEMPSERVPFLCRYRGMAQGKVLPAGVFGEDGLLERATRLLYGAEAGPVVADTLRPVRVDEPEWPVSIWTLTEGTDHSVVYPIAPLSNVLLPGHIFNKYRRRRQEINWRADMTDVLPHIRSQRRVLAEAGRVTSEAAAKLRAVAPKARRGEVLLRQAGLYDRARTLVDLVLGWMDAMDLAVAARTDAAKRPAADAALDALARKADALHADYMAILAKMTDPEGGFVRPALLTVEYVQKEVANIRHSFATGEFLPHPRERMW